MTYSLRSVFVALNCAPIYAFSRSFIPDHDRTPGGLNRYVTQANISQTICVAGWTKTVRPSTAYTNNLKAQQMRELQLRGQARDYEEDHLVPPLCVDGHPTAYQNL